MSRTDHFQEIRTGTSNAILAGLWRRILSDHGIGPTRLSDIVNQYCLKIKDIDSVVRQQYCGNVITDLCSDQITWLTFKRGLASLGVSKATLVFTLHHLNCRTRHTLILEFGDPVKLEELDGEDGEKVATELSVFFPRIMNDLGVTVTKFNQMLTTFMRRHHIDPSRNKRAYARSNLKKDFMKKRLSWASFNKGLDFLTIPAYDIDIYLEFKGRKRNRKSHHHEFIIINDVSELLAKMDAEEFLNPEENDENVESRQTDETSIPSV